MPARLYHLDPAPPPARGASALHERLYTLGVSDVRMRRWADTSRGSFVEALVDRIDAQDLRAVLPVALAAGASCRDVARVGGRWLAHVLPAHRPALEQPHAGRVSAALDLARSEQPDGDLAHELFLQMLADRPARGGHGHVVEVAARIAGLVARRPLIGSAFEAQLIGEHIDELLDLRGPLLASVERASLCEIARAELASLDLSFLPPAEART